MGHRCPVPSRYTRNFLQVLFVMQCGREVEGGSYWILFGQIDKFSYWVFLSKEKSLILVPKYHLKNDLHMFLKHVLHEPNV
jgi:hypothetical protein